MKIAQIAPLWESVPPKMYGGTELVVYNLCEKFKQQGHDVTLFATGDSKISAKLTPIIERPMRELKIKYPLFYELQSVSAILEQAEEFDIIHNHMGYQFFPFANFIKTPIVTTLHGAFIQKEEIEIFNSYKNLNFISISYSQRLGAPHLNYVSTVYNGIEVEKYTYQEFPDKHKPYLAFLGRMSEEKGPHLAIQLAKETGWNLIMAGKVDVNDIEFYKKEVEPLIDGNQIKFIGELGHDDKVELLKNAHATIHTVTWPEPFGLVMAESMACGTPVLALKNGSIPEVINNNISGFIENDIDSLIKKVKDIDKIKRIECRKHIECNFSSHRMAESYLNSYTKIINNRKSKEPKLSPFKIMEN